jgi:hypothetical protein
VPLGPIRNLIECPVKAGDFETALPALVAESSLARDWLTPEEDEAWSSRRF